MTQENIEEGKFRLAHVSGFKNKAPGELLAKVHPNKTSAKSEQKWWSLYHGVSTEIVPHKDDVKEEAMPEEITKPLSFKEYKTTFGQLEEAARRRGRPPKDPRKRAQWAAGLSEEVVEEGRRGRPPKDPAARAHWEANHSAAAGRSPSQVDADQSDAEDAHIMHALRKTVALRGNYKVHFKDGSAEHVHPDHAAAILTHHAGLKTTQDKEAFQDRVHASHDSLKSVFGRSL